ncbi:MAG: nucleoside diphosphate kinase regulator [Candidatus Ratteibacteria bacterium]|nr:nucleoside diphosphate kinase regulator [Candidatus Ratteibacteria bacterium]
MKEREIFITKLDKERLEELISVADEFGKESHQNLADLKMELSRAKLISSQKIPPDVVTMNSKVALSDIDTSKKMTYTLVFPKESDIDEGKISVLAPLGTAMLGYRVGDIIEWQVPSGKRRIKIEKILYQPEASGDFHL